MGKGLKEEYIKARREWKEICKEKKKEEEAELKEIKNKSQVWNYLNRSRKKLEKAENNITKEEWVEQFRTLLEDS